jgi:transketolase
MAEASDGDPELILIATGSELWLALSARAELEQREEVRTRVVSMPCWELFAEQDQGYRDQVLPPSVRARLAVEAAATFGWERWVGEDGEVVGIDHFGASAPGAIVLEKFGFTPGNVADRARALLARLGEGGKGPPDDLPA